MKSPVGVLKAKHKKELKARVASLNGPEAPYSTFGGLGSLQTKQREEVRRLRRKLTKNRFARAKQELNYPLDGGASARKNISSYNWKSLSPRAREAYREQIHLRGRNNSFTNDDVVGKIAELRTAEAEVQYAKRNTVSIWRKIRNWFK